MNRIKNYYLGKSKIFDDDWKYLQDNPELESFLHNAYKNSKLPNVRTITAINFLRNTNNMPEGADPNAMIDVVPDSTNNYKGNLGVGLFKMLSKKNTPRKANKQVSSSASVMMTGSLAATLRASNEASKKGYMFGARDDFENMVSRNFSGNWRNKIKLSIDTKTKQSRRYVNIGDNLYFDDGTYVNIRSQKRGNYRWKPGWRIFGGGFYLY